MVNYSMQYDEIIDMTSLDRKHMQVYCEDKTGTLHKLLSHSAREGELICEVCKCLAGMKTCILLFFHP